MKLKMIAQMSGLRGDGEPWPGPGQEFEVSDEEGALLVHNGIAVPVAEERKAEERPAPADPAVETRAGKPEAKEDPKPKPGPRKA